MTEQNLTHWNKYYEKPGSVPTNPSTFAAFTQEYLKGQLNLVNSRSTLIEFGCGNGRDAIFFNKEFDVIALDSSDVSIEKIRKDHPVIRAEVGDFTKLGDKFKDDEISVVYSRFTLHSITKEQEIDALQWIADNLVPGGYFCVEARSVKSELYGEGEKVGEDSFIAGGAHGVEPHFRRFLSLEKLSAQLEALGFQILYSCDTNGLSVYKGDDPVLVRIIAKKNDPNAANKSNAPQGKRVYVDGIFDLFHVGHLKMIKQAKKLEKGATLVVGVVGDQYAKDYKREPIINEEERAEIIKGLVWTDEVICPAPLEITKEYVEKHKIDVIVHGFADENDKKNFYARHKEPIELGIFKELQYTHGISTSEVIEKIKKM